MKLKLIKVTEEAKGTKSFFWEPDRKLDWIPGQYFYFTLPELKFPDPRGATRHFTTSTSPTEGNILRVTTRIREESGYKQTLDTLPVGTIIDAEGPSGTFVLDEKESGNHIFIAGGIGVTPFRSMIKYAIDKNLDTKIALVYSNSTPEETAFLDELAAWEKQWKNLKLFVTVSHPEESKRKWNGLTGRIDEKLLRKAAGNIHNPTYWLCGPPGLVDAMEETMEKMKISDDKIRTEKFTGY